MQEKNLMKSYSEWISFQRDSLEYPSDSSAGPGRCSGIREMSHLSRKPGNFEIFAINMWS